MKKISIFLNYINKFAYLKTYMSCLIVFFYFCFSCMLSIKKQKKAVPIIYRIILRFFIRLKTAKTICPKNCQIKELMNNVLKIKANSYNTFLIFYTLMITLPLLPFVLYCTLYFLSDKIYQMNIILKISYQRS